MNRDEMVRLLHNTRGHLKTVLHHKALVCIGCFRIGLYSQGLLHDLSKFSPEEFIAGVRFYQGTESPNNEERKKYGASRAWMHHKGRNRHHYEYWNDYNVNKDPEHPIVSVKMPVRYVAEMFVDRVSASKVYRGSAYRDSDPLAYYRHGNAARLMHPETAALLEKLLKKLAEEGEDATYAYIRRCLHKSGKNRKFKGEQK